MRARQNLKIIHNPSRLEISQIQKDENLQKKSCFISIQKNVKKTHKKINPQKRPLFFDQKIAKNRKKSKNAQNRKKAYFQKMTKKRFFWLSYIVQYPRNSAMDTKRWKFVGGSLTPPFFAKKDDFYDFLKIENLNKIGEIWNFLQKN